MNQQTGAAGGKYGPDGPPGAAEIDAAVAVCTAPETACDGCAAEVTTFAACGKDQMNQEKMRAMQPGAEL